METHERHNISYNAAGNAVKTKRLYQFRWKRDHCWRSAVPLTLWGLAWPWLFQQDPFLKLCSCRPARGISVEKVISVNYLHVRVLLLWLRAVNKWREQCFSSTGFRSVHSGVQAGRTGAAFEYLMAVRSQGAAPLKAEEAERGSQTWEYIFALVWWVCAHFLCRSLSHDYFVHVYPQCIIYFRLDSLMLHAVKESTSQLKEWLSGDGRQEGGSRFCFVFCFFVSLFNLKKKTVHSFQRDNTVNNARHGVE